MNQNSKTSFVLYSVLAIVLVGLGIFALSLNQNSNSTDNKSEQNNNQQQDNQDNNNDDNSQTFSLSEELESVFSEIVKSDEFALNTSVSFKTVVSNDDESTTKNFKFDSSYNFIKNEDTDEVQISFENREGNSKSDAKYTLTNDVLYQVKDNEDLVEIKSDDKSINTEAIIASLEELSNYDLFVIPNDAIKSLKTFEERGGDVISLELYNDYISNLFSEDSLSDLSSVFENASVNFDNANAGVTFYIDDKSIIRVLQINELSINSDSTQSFTIKDFVSQVEYRISN